MKSFTSLSTLAILTSLISESSASPTTSPEPAGLNQLKEPSLLLVDQHQTTSQCLTKSPDSNKATIQACTNDADKWIFTSGGLKFARTQSTEDLCLTVPDACDTDGTKLVLDKCAGGKGQQWTYHEDKKWFVWADKNKCLDLTDGSINSGNQVQIYTCSPENPNHRWVARSKTFETSGEAPCQAADCNKSSKEKPESKEGEVGFFTALRDAIDAFFKSYSGGESK